MLHLLERKYPPLKCIFIIFDEITKTAWNQLSITLFGPCRRLSFGTPKPSGTQSLYWLKRSCTCRTDCSPTAPGGAFGETVSQAGVPAEHTFSIVLLWATVDHALWTVIGNVVKSLLNCAEGHGFVGGRLTRIYSCADRKEGSRKPKKKVFQIIDFFDYVLMLVQVKKKNKKKTPKHITEIKKDDFRFLIQKPIFD